MKKLDWKFDRTKAKNAYKKRVILIVFVGFERPIPKPYFDDDDDDASASNTSEDEIVLLKSQVH